VKVASAAAPLAEPDPAAAAATHIALLAQVTGALVLEHDASAQTVPTASRPPFQSIDRFCMFASPFVHGFPCPPHSASVQENV
jgi:hypothetical protein